MVEAGQLQLIGTLDTTDIERGQRKIQVGFDNVQAKTDSSVGSLSSLAGVSKGLLATFAGLGAVAGTSIIGIAANSPQAAASIARIKAQSQQLSFAIGEELAPAFEDAADLYEKFVDSASTEGGFVNTGIEAFSASMEGLITDLDNATNKIQGFFSSMNENTNGRLGKAFDSTLNQIRENGLFGTAFGETGLGLPFAYAGDLGTKARETNIGGSISSYINNELDYNNQVNNNIQRFFGNAFNSARNLFFNTDTTGGNLE